MPSQLLRGFMREASSPATVVCLCFTVLFLMASYWSSSSERFALRTQRSRLLSRIRGDTASLAVLVNTTRRLDRRFRDASRRVSRLTRDIEGIKVFVNRLQKGNKKIRKQRDNLAKKQHGIFQKLSMMNYQKNNNVFNTSNITLTLDELFLYDEESSY